MPGLVEGVRAPPGRPSLFSAKRSAELCSARRFVPRKRPRVPGPPAGARQLMIGQVTGRPAGDEVAQAPSSPW